MPLVARWAAFLAPVLALLFLMVAMGHAPAVFSYANLHAFAAHWLGKLSILGVITLFLWHAAHRLRVTLHDFGLRQTQWLLLRFIWWRPPARH